MQVSQVIQIEDSNHNCIHLIQDALFFRAWEKSAWLFCEYFNDYKINCRFYKNIQRELLWLGFPRTLIPKFIEDAIKLGMKVEKRSETHYCLKIHNQIHKLDFIEWRNRNLLKKHSSEVTTITSTPKAVLSGFRLSYDFCLDIYRVTGRLNKEFKFSLGERLRTNASNISEQFSLWTNNEYEPTKSEITSIDVFARNIRLELRMLKDLQQIREKRWIQLNSNLDSIFVKIDILQASLLKDPAK